MYGLAAGFLGIAAIFLYDVFQEKTKIKADLSERRQAMQTAIEKQRFQRYVYNLARRREAAQAQAQTETETQLENEELAETVN